MAKCHFCEQILSDTEGSLWAVNESTGEIAITSWYEKLITNASGQGIKSTQSGTSVPIDHLCPSCGQSPL